MLIVIILCTISFQTCDKPKVKLSKIVYKKVATINYIEVRGTYYCPLTSQCDSTPLVTSSNSFIDTNLLKQNKLRWIAVSRDLLKRHGGKLKYHQKVFIHSNNKKIHGYWYVKDTMNKRYKKRIDFLSFSKITNLDNLRLIL